MGVLVPALLALAAAAIVPIVLHLLQRHQGPRVVFPALRYLRRAEKESARQIRLRQLLLLLLRVAALLLLAVAAAQPFIRGAGASHEPSAVAIILDNSLSSGTVSNDRRVLDVLKAHALETLLRAGPDDRFWLLRAGAPWEPALPGDAETTAARVRETEPTAAASDLAAAVAHAAALLATGAEGRAREIQILSDAQESAFRGAVDRLDDELEVVILAPGNAPPNRGVADVEIGGGLAPVEGQRSTVAVAIAGSGSDTVGVRLSLDGRTIAAGSAPVGSSAVLPLPARRAGVAAGHVEIDADALRGDDRRYIAMHIEPPPSVRYAGTNEFIRDALDVLADAGRIRREGGRADVSLLPSAAGIDALPAATAAVVLPPESPLELPALNRRLASAQIPWRYEPRTGSGEARIAATQGADDLMRPLERVRIRSWYALQRAGTGADTVLITMADGAPWAVRGMRGGGGVYVLLSTPLEETASTIPTSPAMLPLMDRVTGTWSATTAASPVVAPGESVALPDAADALLLPDGTREPVTGGSSFRGANEPGVYHVLAGPDTLTAFAVNPPPAESDLTRLDEDELRGWIDGASVAVPDADDWARTVFRHRLGAESWRPFALLALLLLLVEPLLAASGRVTGTRGTGTARRTSMNRPSPVTD
ncbi:MAG TPA: BatA domain-containing protein [Longimicrobiales bacterium]|nr:BatA domain-containing protein [Longimicrobiales bacterium]